MVGCGIVLVSCGIVLMGCGIVLMGCGIVLVGSGVMVGCGDDWKAHVICPCVVLPNNLIGGNRGGMKLVTQRNCAGSVSASCR